MSFFSLDSKFMQAMSRIADLIILNILFLLTCLPIFTIGAASAALYSVCFRIGTEKEAGVFRPYFRAFRENFKQGTALCLLLLLISGMLCLNIAFFSNQAGWLHCVTYLSIPLLAMVVFIWSYVFPLQSQFINPVKTTLANALMLSIGYLPRTLLLAVFNAGPFILLLVNPLLFLQVGFLWLALYFSAAAYLNALLLRKVFAPYMPPVEEAQ